jgi:hypothetical protein
MNTAGQGPDIVYDASRTILSRLSLSDALLARRISPAWKADVDNLMEEAWKAVRKGIANPTSAQPLAGMIAHVTKEAFNACSLEHLENCPLGQEVSACELFGRLNQLFKKTYGIRLDFTRSLDSLTEQIQELQIKQQPIDDRDLCAIWPKIRAELLSTATSAPSPAATANEIRAWMMDPANAAHLTDITRLNLDALELKTIPLEIGQLSQLSRLNLSNNQITSIPDAMGQLSKLSRLYLSHNQITSIPDAIGQRSQLTWLSLFHNQITSIPDAIGQFSPGGYLDLCNNPILYITKAVLTSFRRNNYTIKTFSEALQWDAKSALAKLCLAIMQDRDRAMQDMLELLSQLSPEERGQIFFHVWDLNNPSQTPNVRWGEHHALDNPELFMRAVHRSIVGHLKALPQYQRDAVYRRIGQLAGEGEKEGLQWGKDHATENLPRLADALTELKNNKS